MAGTGRATFALPDLRGRVPIHREVGFVVGQRQVREIHTLTLAEMAA